MRGAAGSGSLSFWERAGVRGAGERRGNGVGEWGAIGYNRARVYSAPGEPERRMKNRMKRRVSRVLLVLAAGVVVNVAVAWAIGILGLRSHVTESAYEIISRRHDAEKDRNLIEEIWRVDVYRGPGVVAFAVRRAKGIEITASLDDSGTIRPLLPAWSNLATPTEEFAAIDIGQTDWPRGNNEVLEHRSNMAMGWPLPVLWCESVIDESGIDELTIVGGMLLQIPADPERFPRVLPYRVILPNFAANAALYAVLCALVWFTPGMIRRRIRVRRGLCQVCGYPVQREQRCSECGTIAKGQG